MISELSPSAQNQAALAVLMVGLTLYSLFTLSRRWPLVGIFLISMLWSAFGGRGRRRW
jgi:hypothetical protein